MLTKDFKEKRKLSEIEFKAFIQYGIIWVIFKSPLLSKNICDFLEKQDFILFIDEESGMTGGIWASGPYPEKEYNILRNTFKSYGVELPPLSDLPVES